MIIIATESSKVSEHTLTCFWNLFRYSIYSDDFIIRQKCSKRANGWLAKMYGATYRSVKKKNYANKMLTNNYSHNVLFLEMYLVMYIIRIIVI